ncbi:HupE/UreJ family protein [Sphaerotilus sp.]|uniref:HupE/UreJ family protein n=1 Tax=Sphaerotilus sp. TaxID=2093942 RepID=UPI0034E28A07
MTIHRLVSWLLALAALSIGPAALAHKPSDAYLTLQVDGTQIEQRLDVHLRDLDRELVLDRNDDGRLQWAEVHTRWAELQRYTTERVHLSVAGQPCTSVATGQPQLDDHTDGAYAVLRRRWTCPAGAQVLAIDYRLFAETDASHRGLLRLSHGAGAPQTAVLVPGSPLPTTVSLMATATGNAPSGFGGFVAEGIHHILIGTDHVLFLLALLLPAVLVSKASGWREAATQWRPMLTEVLKIVTAFTVAHSVTLALAVLDIVDPPSRWVESLIAVSVVFTAINNLRPMLAPQHRWRLTLVFGLVHGFGFAGALKDLGLGGGSLAASLLGFNLGVELGQLSLVALFLPLAWWARSTRFYQRGVLIGGSSAVALIAAAWVVERVFDLKLLGS